MDKDVRQQIVQIDIFFSQTFHGDIGQRVPGFKGDLSRGLQILFFHFTTGNIVASQNSQKSRNSHSYDKKDYKLFRNLDFFGHGLS